MKIAYALRVDIFKSQNLGDCSNDGISTFYDDILLLCDEGYIEVDLNNPPTNLCKVVERPFGTKAVEPYVKPNEGWIGWMYGGTIVDSSDSRFNEMSGGVPLHLHDRQETYETYEMLSR